MTSPGRNKTTMETPNNNQSTAEDQELNLDLNSVPDDDIEEEEGELDNDIDALASDDEFRHRMEVIQNMTTPEEIEAAKQLFETGDKSFGLKKQDNPEKEPAIEVKPEDQKPADDTSKKETPEQSEKDDKTPKAPITNAPSEEDKAKAEQPGKAYLIDDDFIKSQPEQDRKILQNFKGEYISPKALKSLVNAQHLVGRRQEKAEAIKNEPPLTQFPQKETLSQQTPEGADAVKQNMVLRLMQQKYPEMPTDPDELKQYKADLNYTDPDAYFQLREDEKSFRTQVEKDYKDIVYLQENYADLNTQEVHSQVNGITEQLKGLGLNPEDLGLDLKFDEKGNNAVIDALLDDGKGNIKPHLVSYIAGVPLINRDTLVVEFMRQNLVKIKDAVAEKSRKEGYLAAQSKKPLQTLASTPIQGNHKAKTSYTISDINEINDPALLDRLEQQVSQKLR
jgi:hypothetical protein